MEDDGCLDVKKKVARKAQRSQHTLPPLATRFDVGASPFSSLVRTVGRTRSEESGQEFL